MKLTHHTDKEFVRQTINGNGKFFEDNIMCFKPHGFWLSVNGSWEEWLEDNWESWLKGKVCLNVELDKGINLFIIETKKQFLEEFKKLTGKNYLNLDTLHRFDLSNFHKKLKEKYDGIWLKSEPFYKHRLDFNFMYFHTWDCESICVWNKKKIVFKEIKNDI